VRKCEVGVERVHVYRDGYKDSLDWCQVQKQGHREFIESLDFESDTLWTLIQRLSELCDLVSGPGMNPESFCTRGYSLSVPAKPLLPSANPVGGRTGRLGDPKLNWLGAETGDRRVQTEYGEGQAGQYLNSQYLISLAADRGPADVRDWSCSCLSRGPAALYLLSVKYDQFHRLGLVGTECI
jgi:hypothetical protein